MKRMLIAALLLAATLAACGPQPEPRQVITPITQPDTNSQDNPQTGWLNTPLTDVMTSEQFTISDYAGEPVLIESFAVWCPTCKRQQQEMQELDATHVTINTDPNEDAAQVREYVQQNGFSGRYVVASSDYTQQLIDTFGVEIVNAPSAPVVLLCADQQEPQLLPRGVKTAEELQGYIEQRC